MLNINAIRYGENDYTFSSNDKYLYFEVEDDVLTSKKMKRICKTYKILMAN